ncbi:MAG: NAD(P)-dependent oxidoreductase [Gemmatimonadaceae bacterium]
MREDGIATIRCDLADRAAVARLPDAPNVFLLAGQKFGTGGAPALTWGANVVVPALVADRYAASRIVAFSTGNVYRLGPPAGGGAVESDDPDPVGEYAMSCLGRERVLEYAAATHGTRSSIIRLNYAVDLRYGVLVDIARNVLAGTPIDLAMGYVNVIWQGDANAYAVASLAYATAPPFVLNVTGRDILSVRAAATKLGTLLGRTPVFVREELPDALLSNASRAIELFGPPRVDSETLIAWVGAWVGRGGSVLGKPTHFEARDGHY